MIDCTGQCESALLLTDNGLIRLSIVITILLCLMPDNFAHQGESGLRLLSVTSIEI